MSEVVNVPESAEVDESNADTHVFNIVPGTY